MSRTLLPVFSKYSIPLNLDAKEPVEDFSFMRQERSDYERFRAGLDSIPGSREYLKAYKAPEESPAFHDYMGIQIMCAAGNHHNGASATCLGFQYKFLLTDWDSWVKAVKMREAKDAYHLAQLKRPSTWQFANAQTDEEQKKAIKSIRIEFSLSYSDEEIATMLCELIDEFNEDMRVQMIKEEKERFDNSISLLEHHYKHPMRWNDYGDGQLKSALFGSIYGITEPMFVAMEKKHPGYRNHISDIMKPHSDRCACVACYRKRIADGTDAEYFAWVQAEADAVIGRPKDPVIAAAAADSAIAAARIMPGGDTDVGFAKNLFKTVQGVNYDDKCPHALPFYACMSCSH